jgi:hypothetical protein
MEDQAAEMETSHRFQWRWLRHGIGLAMRVDSPRKAYRSWYVIHPLDANRAATRAVLRSFHQPMPQRDVQVYHVRRLETRRLSLGQILRQEDGDTECVDEFFAYGENHLRDRLQQRGLSIATFYPLTTAAVHDEHGVQTLRPASL